MCHIKNTLPVKAEPSRELTQDFDSWFESLKSDLNKSSNTTKVQNESLFNDLFVPTSNFASPMTSFPDMLVEPTPIEETVEAHYPSPKSTSSPKPTTTLSQKRESENDEDNSLAKKRQRQNEAAKRCRQKKLNLLQEAQEQVQKFEKEKFEMAVKLAVLEKERESWKTREADLQQRILSLKSQLDESHMLLMNISKV